MQRDVYLILGGPGTGKTTYFVGRDATDDQAGVDGIIGQLLASGVRPHEIAYVSFTRKAADEAAQRAADRFGFDRADLPYFRTIHSLAFKHTGMSQANVMQREDYREIAKLLGVHFTGYIDPADGPAAPSREGDLILQWMSYARARCLDLKDVWRHSGEAVEWNLARMFELTVENYKRDTGKHDFADMLDAFVAAGIDIPVKVAIIDEAQDLSTAQWRVVRTAFRRTPVVYFAGDDDQSVHTWAGADVEHLFRIRAERTVLPVSHRLPREVFDLSTAVAKRIKQRFPKDWQPAQHSGHVHHLPAVDAVDLRQGGTWMLLGRNSVYLREYEAICRQQGIPYSTVRGKAVDADELKAIVLWERLRQGAEVPAQGMAHVAGFIRGYRYQGPLDGGVTLASLDRRPEDGIWHDTLTKISAEDREYYAHCLRNGYRLQDAPPVHISTIHGVKGGEADNVVLKTDMTYRTQQGMERDPDNEHRVFYVGATRAKKKLFIIDPQESGGYEVCAQQR